MNPRLSGYISILGLVFYVLKSLLGIARQRSGEKFAIFVRMLASNAATSASPSRVLNFQDGVALLFSSFILSFSTFSAFKMQPRQYFELFDMSSSC